MSSANDFLQLIIRTANNKHADFEIQISPLQTVLDLKEKIQFNHPTKPVPKDQRLIFAGKLLVDAAQLQDVFSKSTSLSLMIHLVLDSDKNSPTPKSPSAPKVQPPPEPTPVENKPTTTSNHSSTYEQYLTELNQYQQQLQQFLINPNGSLPMNSYESQAYLQYCYTHYQMYQNLHAYQRTVASPISINTSPASQSNVNPTPPAAAAAAPPPAAAAAGAGNNNNNDLEPENDLLGILNMLVELFVLCSIIYFYSTFSRFLLVFLFFALLYLHCRGYLSLRGRRRVQPPPPPAPVVPEQPAGNEGGGGTDEEAEVEANANDNPRQHSPAPPPDPFGNNQVSATRLLLTAVSTFFSSLIPERPQRA